MDNERGGIISKLFIIPIGVALMAGFFFLGYYVGKYQSKTNQNEIVVPLPEVVSKNLPKKEDFTFYKTLTDKSNKTVSIDLKPQPENGQAETDKKAVPDQEKKKPEPKKEARPEMQPEKPAPVKETNAKPQPAKKEVVKKEPQTAKKEPQIAKNEPRLHYTLQIASYQEKSQAEDDVRRLKQQGYAAFVQGTELEGKGTWYRVRLGSFTNKASAEKLQKEVQAKVGVTPIITIE